MNTAKIGKRLVKWARDMQNDWAEVKIRAECRAGELLGKTDKALGGRPRKTPSKKVGVLRTPTLADSGIDYKLSSRAQVFALLSESKFDQIIENGLRGDLISIREYKIIKRKLEPVIAKPPLPRGVFRVIYADPPWPMTKLER